MDQKTLDNLWKRNLIAIHYEDIKSYDPDRYNGRSAKGAFNTLNKISKDGGYVFAMYENKNDYKIGLVEPGTEIEYVDGVYGDKNGNQGQKAILKCIKFKESMKLPRLDALSLICAQPRQGTLCTWHAVGKRVENIFNGIPMNTSVSNLTPDLQEVLCSEYLKLGIDKNLPKIESLLTPVGRTMIDADIVGLTNESKRILVQVTYGNQKDYNEKIDKLKKYSNDNCELILFCKNPGEEQVGSVKVYDIEKIFDKFIKTEVGMRWIETIK